MPSESDDEEVRGSNQMRHDKANDSCLRGLDRHRVLRRVGIVLAFPVEASVPHDRGEKVDLLKDPAFRGPESQLVQVHRCAVGAIIDILESVAEAVANAILVDRWGISLSIAHRTRIDSSSHSRHNSFPCHHRF